MAECCAGLIDGDEGIDPDRGIESGLCSKTDTHTVFIHMPAAFVEAAGAGENTLGATM